MRMGLGPVAVFGASNFPLAFSVAGGDTASALAAGCTVVVKAHPSHPGTSELIFAAIVAAAKACGMPDGVVSMLHGVDPGVSLSLVRHPLTQAVGFTGSFRAGRAIFDTAMARATPIPVFAEMGSTNPVFLLPKALSERADKIAEALKNSVMMGVGQFCTKPGIVVAIDDAATLKLNWSIIRTWPDYNKYKSKSIVLEDVGKRMGGALGILYKRYIFDRLYYSQY